MRAIVEIVGGEYPVWVAPDSIDALVSKGLNRVAVILASGQVIDLQDITIDALLDSLDRVNHIPNEGAPQ